MKNLDLTKKQQNILNVICKYLQEKGYPPSHREIAKIVNLASPSTVKNYLDILKKKGYVDWETGRPRTLKILKH